MDAIRVKSIRWVTRSILVVSTLKYSEGILMPPVNESFFDVAQELLCIIDFEGKIIRTNRAWSDLLEHDRKELQGIDFEALIHEDDQAATQGVLARLKALPKTENYTSRLKAKNQNFRWLKWRLKSDHTKQCIFASALDITESKRNLSYLETLTDFKGIGYWEIDLDTERLFWSRHVHRIHETDPETYQPILQDGLNFYHPESIPILTEAVNRQIATGEPYDLELRFITAKGNHKWVKASSHSEFIAGKPVRLFGLFEDITQAVKKREQDSLLKERIELAHRASGIGVWEFDLLEDKLIWDKSMYEIYDLNPKDFSGDFEAWVKSLHPDEKERCDEALQLALAGEKEFILDFRIITGKNEVRHISAIATVLRDKNKRPEKMLGVNWDITEHEKNKQELKEKSLIAERSNKAKSLFIANMSHELRTPLNSVLGYSKRILKTEKNLSPRAAKGIETINKSGHYLLSLINDLLDLSKIDAGRFELNINLVDISALVAECCAEHRIHAEEKDLTLESNIAEGVHGDTDQIRLKQILNNLISNAIKYTREGKIDVQLTQQNSHCILEITDTGLGIREEDKPRLFKRFEQFDKNSKFRIGSGTGLGLAITWELLKLLGGKIHLESELDHGTSFTITLPKKHRQPEIL